MKRIIYISLLLVTSQIKAEVRLPQYFSDGMVLQRDQEIKIWGWAEKGEKIQVSFNGQTKSAKAGKKGKWDVTFEAMSASFDPLEMKVIGENEIVLQNILIGDIWICSGQSNMEWPVSSSNNFKEEIENAQYPNIRLLDVPRQLEFIPVEDIKPTGWKTAEGSNITEYSAVGYFFGRHIHESQKVPIGLISTNWGGTTAEAWTSAEKLAPLEYTAESLAKMKGFGMTYEEKKKEEIEKLNEWLSKYIPQTDLGEKEQWYSNDYSFQDWKSITIPSAIEEQAGLENFDGTVWFKKKFQLNSALAGNDLYIRLGTIRDVEVIYLNGKKVIENINPKEWRSYKIPADAFEEEGENILTIKVFNGNGEGGLVEERADKISVSPARWQVTEHDVPLAGKWKYKVSNPLNEPVTAETPSIVNYRPNDYPSSLFNGMIHPLIPMAIKGVIWYQGESNAKPFDRAIRYEEVIENMISDWRERWGYDFEFYFVQLANYWNKEERCEQPCEQSWAYLRESQTNTLDLENTGMAVIYDAGDAKDIHPRDKQTVGYRLGLIADAKAYEKEVVYSGPKYQSHEVKGNEIKISFDHVGAGLKADDRYGYVNGFQVAGADKVFHWAKARIEGEQIVVGSDKVDKPVAVRYAWENNPEDANFYNEEGLPAIPFRTDDWVLYQE